MKAHRLQSIGRLSTISIAAAGLLLAAGADLAAQEKQKAGPIELFDGKSLAGWSHVLVDKAVKKEDVWSVKDGILVCKGEPLGYLFTDGSYQDFELQLEWRWAPGGKPGNSGVLLRIAGEPVGFMPKCVEAQLQSGSAGDIWAFFGAKVGGDAKRLREVKDHKALGNFKGIGKIKAAEKSPGEWNKYVITVKGGGMKLEVNGELVNKATGLDVVAGPIGLQSEGGEIHFRKVQLTTL